MIEILTEILDLKSNVSNLTSNIAYFEKSGVGF
jgi:hypothetical protein